MGTFNLTLCFGTEAFGSAKYGAIQYNSNSKHTDSGEALSQLRKVSCDFTPSLKSLLTGGES